MTIPKHLWIKLTGGAAIFGLILIAALFPKPSLITYEKAGIQSRSVYWQGFKEYGKLSDSKANYVKRDSDSPYLHVCYEPDDSSSCQRFTIIKEEGLVAVILHSL